MSVTFHTVKTRLASNEHPSLFLKRVEFAKILSMGMRSKVHFGAISELADIFCKKLFLDSFTTNSFSKANLINFLPR